MDFVKYRINIALNELKNQIYYKSVPIEGFRYKKCGYKTDSILPKVDSSWKTLKPGETWGGDNDGHYWFYNTITVEGNDPVYFTIKTGREREWDATNPQFIIYMDGEIIQAMDVNHNEILITKRGTFEVYIYAWVGMISNQLNFDARLLYKNEACNQLYYDIKVPFDVSQLHNAEEREYYQTMNHITNALNILDLRTVGSDEFYSSVKAADEYMQREFYGKYCKKDQVTTVCIGHTHIDVAWMWTLAQTREKAVRSFSTVVNLMKQFPDYKFMSSQAHLYKVVKEDAPELYAEIKELVRQGRWEVEGAMWVEADCNLTSGESLVRQVMFGKRFFKDEFGVDSKILWLPDVFGYSAALPQILKKSGVDKFVTSKISWNEVNKMPYDTFNWKGIDGTEIFSYFLTAQNKNPNGKPPVFTTYNAMLTPSMVSGTWDRFQQKELTDETLLTFGYGDGGGGPTECMLETAKRLEKGVPGCPNVKIDTATNFLNKLERKTRNNPKLPKWVGELYLEYHRGTYTSMAKNKRNNRKSEFAYQTVELFSTINKSLLNADYPQEEINAAWEIILTNQFHDIVPGSSIKEVYDDTDVSYAKVFALAEKITSKCYKGIAKNIKTNGGYVVFNSNSFDNSDVIDIDGKKVFVENIPSNGYKVVDAKPVVSSVKVDDSKIENKFYKIVFNKDYSIKSIYDKKNKREVLSGNGNVIQAFEDRPRAFDAWEITNYYTEKMWEVTDVVSVTKIDEGARAGLKIVKKFMNSIIEQTIFLYNDISKIDFDNEIDWKEHHILLKAAFPLDVHTDSATYDIQFGNLSRPTHRNTSWDEAKFEVCAHKFADMSEDDYGVSLINDCKYGYDALGSTLRITLLKSATHPNPDADKCHHTFTYTLYPHKGDFKAGGTIQTAYALNRPMTAVKVGKQNGSLPEEFSFVKCDCENVIIETVKQAEDSKETVIRMFDTYNRRSNATVSFGTSVKKAVLCDLMENEIKEIPVKDNKINLLIKPFEIVTIKIS